MVVVWPQYLGLTLHALRSCMGIERVLVSNDQYRDGTYYFVSSLHMYIQRRKKSSKNFVVISDETDSRSNMHNDDRNVKRLSMGEKNDSVEQVGLGCAR